MPWLISTKTIILKLIQLQGVLLLLWAFSSFSDIATATPAAKLHQIIVLIGRLAGWSHFNDLSSRLEALPYMEQRTLKYCVYVASVRVHTSVVCACRSAWRRILSRRQCAIGFSVYILSLCLFVCLFVCCF